MKKTTGCKEFTRRDFAKGSALLLTGLGAASMMGGCSPSGEGPSASPASADSPDIAWDKEADFVVVGAGVGLIGALAASEEGGSVIVLEKSSMLGGVTFGMSGGGQWVPGNNIGIEAGYEMKTPEETLEYLKKADMYGGSSDENKMSFIENAHKAVSYYQDAWGFKFSPDFWGDYYQNDYSQRFGNSFLFCGENGEEFMGIDAYTTYIEPLLDQRADLIETLTQTPAKRLVLDADRRVIGVEAESGGSSLFVKANKGVLLAAGGFDRNEDMVGRYLSTPIAATMAYSENTGDGILMGMEIGADLQNMAATVGGTAIITNADKDMSLSPDNIFDMCTIRGTAYCMTVNKRGRRFFNESCSYAASSRTYDGYGAAGCSFSNIPAYMIFTDTYVQLVGWPGGEESQPAYVKKFESISEIADHYGMEEGILTAEIDRFNGFCETGIDLDFGRGQGVFEQACWDVENGWTFTDETRPLVASLANSCLGPIQPPYYVAVQGPGSFNTCGGLRIDTDFRVLDIRGNAIEGLYSCGSCCATPTGIYGGSGGALGPGFYGAFRAACHAMGLSLVDFS